MAPTFTPATRENVGLLIAYAGGSGSGKTMSGMRTAQGIVGRENKFAVIDTENGRAKHYAPLPGQEPDFNTTFRFDVLELEAPFSPERYEEAIIAARDAGYGAIMVDSMTHEHDNDGGYLFTQEQELDKLVKGYMQRHPNESEYKVREKFTPSSWVKPSRARKKLIQTLLLCSTRIPIICCFRAEEKSFGTKDGKMVSFNPPKWEPVAGKQFPFEMTVFLMLHHEKPGVPMQPPVKLLEQHRHIFPVGKPLDEECGKRIASWARGGAAAPAQRVEQPEGDQEQDDRYISFDQTIELSDLLDQIPGGKKRMFDWMAKNGVEIQSLAFIPADKYHSCKSWIEAATEAAANARE